MFSLCEIGGFIEQAEPHQLFATTTHNADCEQLKKCYLVKPALRINMIFYSRTNVAAG